MRSLLNIANSVEPASSFFVDDRFSLSKQKLKSIVEQLRTVQNRLLLADFQCSASFTDYLHSEIDVQELGKAGDEYEIKRKHQTLVNDFAGHILELVQMD